MGAPWGSHHRRCWCSPLVERWVVDLTTSRSSLCMLEYEERESELKHGEKVFLPPLHLYFAKSIIAGGYETSRIHLCVVVAPVWKPVNHNSVHGPTPKIVNVRLSPASSSPITSSMWKRLWKATSGPAPLNLSFLLFLSSLYPQLRSAKIDNFFSCSDPCASHPIFTWMSMGCYT